LHNSFDSCSNIELMIRNPNDTVAPSQTLDRGLLCLDYVAANEHPVSIDDVAASTGLHRSIVYRLLRTLELRALVERVDDGSYVPGPHLAVLSRSVRRTLRAAAAPVLVDLAEELGMTAFIVVADRDEAVTVDSVEPRGLDAHVSYRPGTRHALDKGAPGLALLAARQPRRGERAEVTTARRRGWAHSKAEVIAGLEAIAAPILDQGAVAVLWPAGGRRVATDVLGRRLVAAAEAITARLDP
jgi:DNA-binding IclR family transcriptional regulator